MFDFPGAEVVQPEYFTSRNPFQSRTSQTIPPADSSDGRDCNFCCHGDFSLNIIVVLENQSNKQRYEQAPYPFAGRLDVRCLCGSPIHPILGAWCPQCGAKVIEVRDEKL